MVSICCTTNYLCTTSDAVGRTHFGVAKKKTTNDDEVQIDGSGKVREFIISRHGISPDVCESASVYVIRVCAIVHSLVI